MIARTLSARQSVGLFALATALSCPNTASASDFSALGDWLIIPISVVGALIAMPVIVFSTKVAVKLGTNVATGSKAWWERSDRESKITLVVAAIAFTIMLIFCVWYLDLI